MTYALCSCTSDNVYRVACVDCRVDLGTMTAEILRRAIIFAIEFGGVKCPDCRAISCNSCGEIPYRGLDLAGHCFFCKVDAGLLEAQENEGLLELQILADKQTDGEVVCEQDACLVKQKSRND